MFDENNVCTITMTHEGQTIRLEITDNGEGGYSFTQFNVSEEAETATTATTFTTKTGIYTPENESSN